MRTEIEEAVTETSVGKEIAGAVDLGVGVMGKEREMIKIRTETETEIGVGAAVDQEEKDEKRDHQVVCKHKSEGTTLK